MTLTTTDTRKLAHLLRRAGFGARPSEWTEYARLGVAGTGTVKLTSRRAQKSSIDVSVPRSWRKRRRGASAIDVSASRKEVWRSD